MREVMKIYEIVHLKIHRDKNEHFFYWGGGGGGGGGDLFNFVSSAFTFCVLTRDCLLPSVQCLMS